MEFILIIDTLKFNMIFLLNFLITYLKLTTLRESDKCSLHTFFVCQNHDGFDAVKPADDDNEETTKVFLNF